MFKRIKLSLKKEILSNNSGMTLVELIVTFSLVMIIVVGIFSFILQAKSELSDKQIMKNLTEYSSTINNDIHYNLIQDDPFVIVYKEKDDSDWSGFCYDGSEPFIQENKLYNSCGKKFGEENLSCAENGIEIYPCAVYGYEKNDTIKFKDIGINYRTEEATEEATNGIGKRLGKFGIKYDGIYEKAPDQKYIILSNSGDVNDGIINKDKLSLYVYGPKNVEHPGFFEIEVPFFFDGNNYGFKIAYPFIKLD